MKNIFYVGQEIIVDLFLEEKMGIILGEKDDMFYIQLFFYGIESGYEEFILRAHPNAIKPVR